MARIEGVRKPRGLYQRLLFWMVKRRFGRVMEPLRVMCLHPQVLSANAALELKLEKARALSGALKGLVEQRVAQLIGCPFCLDLSQSLNLKRGTEAAKLQALPRWRESSQFTEAERAALEYAEAMTRLPLEVSDALFERLRAHFSDQQIIELTEFAALENKRSRFNHALGMKAEGFSEGALCHIPAAGRRSAA